MSGKEGGNLSNSNDDNIDDDNYLALKGNNNYLLFLRLSKHNYHAYSESTQIGVH